MSEIPIRTPDRKCEVAWFSALCSDDYKFLGIPDGSIRSNFQHCGDIVKMADALGYQNIFHKPGMKRAASFRALPPQK